MTIRSFGATGDAVAVGLLEKFEEQFTYPLGAGQRFRVSHGEDYSRFYRAIGDARCFVAETNGSVAGVICAAVRTLQLPGGREMLVGYLGDLKVDEGQRYTRTLLVLARAVNAWLDGRIQGAYSVVMEGTSAVPSRYTGRLGVPSFRELGRLYVLRVPTVATTPRLTESWDAAPDRGEAIYRRLAGRGYASLGGFPEHRSDMKPAWLVHQNGHACGRLEDTRRAKRLYAEDNSEILSAHLSCFAFTDVAAGIQLLSEASMRAATNGFPALFVALPESLGKLLCEALQNRDFVVAPATVFGAGFDRAGEWYINSAEI